MVQELEKDGSLENMSLAFDKSTVVKEYKVELETLEKRERFNSQKTRRDNSRKGVFRGKARQLGILLKTRKRLVDTKHQLSIN